MLDSKMNNRMDLQCNTAYIPRWKIAEYNRILVVLNGFLGEAGAIPPLANVKVGDNRGSTNISQDFKIKSLNLPSGFIATLQITYIVAINITIEMQRK
uniref:Uncharacterized protein n=1 Tax=Romanomermis culicivorax TaxID=13658 RepID=A0A915IG09_ROMCU